MASILITAPSSAKEGDKVSVAVHVINTRSTAYTFKTEIFSVPDLYPHELIFSTEEIISPGHATDYFTSFTMPDCNTTVFVWVELWDVDHWTYDGSASKVVTLEMAPVPEFAGTISKKELEYDETRGNIPVY